MPLRWFFPVIGLFCMALLSACERHQDNLTPAAKTEAGREKAQDYPSTRNTENPDPSIGGTNSATTRQEPEPPGTTASNPTGAGGSGDVTSR